jgi:glycosyltransferase involved in cell wall biosynthesis
MALNYERQRFKFGIILSTSLGNLTRYQNFYKYAQRDADIDFTWAPVKHYLAPHEGNPFRRLPGSVAVRLTVFYEARQVLKRLAAYDALLIHMYEVDIYTALRGYLYSKPFRIVSTDDAPVFDPSTYPVHPVDLNKPAWKRWVRLRLDVWRARRADLLIPFSTWSAKILVEDARIHAARVSAIHVGVDLDLWRDRTAMAKPASDKVVLLFVGADFVRKGGTLLLDIFQRHFTDVAELHIVTKSDCAVDSKSVYIHSDFEPNDVRLSELYRRADIFVLPTTSDLSSWATLEAMASGCATIVTPVAGVAELVEHGVTGLLIAVNDRAGLTRAIESLIADPEKRRSMGRAGRRKVESEFNAEVNVPKILALMKSVVLERRV